MKNTKITRNKNEVLATYLPYKAYTRALELATEHKGEIGKTADGNFKATFNSVETAKKFVAQWTTEYNANRKVDLAPTPKSTPAQKPKASKPTATKGKKAETVTVVFNGVEYKVNQADLVPTQAPKTSSTKKTKAPRKAKGEAFDFSKFKGTKSEKNRELHATLVGMGIGDSRTKEYLAVWNARPWAK